MKTFLPSSQFKKQGECTIPYFSGDEQKITKEECFFLINCSLTFDLELTLKSKVGS